MEVSDLTSEQHAEVLSAASNAGIGISQLLDLANRATAKAFGFNPTDLSAEEAIKVRKNIRINHLVAMANSNTLAFSPVPKKAAEKVAIHRDHLQSLLPNPSI